VRDSSASCANIDECLMASGRHVRAESFETWRAKRRRPQEVERILDRDSALMTLLEPRVGANRSDSSASSKRCKCRPLIGVHSLSPTLSGWFTVSGKLRDRLSVGARTGLSAGLEHLKLFRHSRETPEPFVMCVRIFKESQAGCNAADA